MLQMLQSLPQLQHKKNDNIALIEKLTSSQGGVFASA